jgi:hypothetical protein
VALRFELDDMQQRFDAAAAIVERAEQAEGLFRGQLVWKLRLLQLDPEALPQLALVRVPAQAEHFDLAGVRRHQAFEDLDGRRFARPIRAEQAEAFAARDIQREIADGHDIAVGLAQRVARECEVAHASILT